MPIQSGQSNGVAVGDPYVTAAELKTYLGIGDTVDDTAISNAVYSASRSIEKFTGRQFNDAGAATARSYFADSCRLVEVDDFSTTTGLVVATDEGDDGTAETTWTITTDFYCTPLNGIVDAESGWPYWQIRGVGTRTFPVTGYRPAVSVTARWGWTSVPYPVKQAAFILAADIFKMAAAPFGVAGVGDWGMIRVRNNPQVVTLLAPYKRHGVLVG